ncbi:polysaccharide biosynthesis protein [Lacinutrix sp. C3R15]|uniref:nucleoside-diphosphate sugar epimerase/dehydratase n=1 Tax=Flavobacteriaceae TaxID=49546 RepID=UPI001C09F7EB|nr:MULTISPECIES: nucleoside-diphosphate sugar epimerase/dehydratase [Flavobacteriaceae]MBU2938633.1 polysaccharide biosynthesis protein [Lacinutrix sp. C3R15]MDO6621947.1 nucleoside-diphosphate sugar epimerase/dehydratase [Oceanihabitans sp. 1_MG-2023]
MNYNDILRKLTEKYASKWLVLLFDSCIVIFTFFIAYIIRFNFEIDFNFYNFLKQLPFVFVATIISFLIVNSHKGVVRFTGVKDVVNVVIGLNILATILIISTYISRKYNFDSVFDIPGSIIYIHLLLNIFFLIGTKFFIKSMYRSLFHDFDKLKTVLIYGAGNSGMITYDAITNDAKNNIKVFGFLDDKEGKIGKKINMLNVYNPKKIDKEFVEKNKIDEVIISIQSINSNRLLEISGSFFALNLKVKIVPDVQHWIDGDLSIGQIKDIKIEDLLGREPIRIDNPLLIDEYNNKVLLVTGAAGSIGSELVRKLSHFKFKKLIIIDNSESALYDLQQELKRNKITNTETIVADVRNKQRLDQIFNIYKPQIIFHAAAYKHVPLMEKNPFEAVSVNVFGTYNVAELAMKHGADKFILISTDKAVNPTNVMGATKRIAEISIFCQKKIVKGKTKFIITRFGNVLGSNGSVIPLFKKQIETGGPLTVTHKDIIRYFMTIPEASQLVLEAAAMGLGEEIFVFDMGKPIKIIDLAKNMIALSGLNYPEDIDIKIIGLRPGEKIFEELLIDGENTKPTYNEKIMIAKCKEVTKEQLDKIKKLLMHDSTSSNIEIVSLIKDIVPEYNPNNTKYDVLNIK